jgi:hypothetical protein
VDSLENVFGNATLNSAVRSLENMLRDTFTNTLADQLQEDRLIQQAIFDSLREPMPVDDPIEAHDISGSNNESD